MKFEILNTKQIRNKKSETRKGFTLVELMVSVAIFVFMTVLLVAKYGNFNQSTLLTDLAYDVALTIRTAQTYGTSVRVADTGTAGFQTTYGVHFTTDTDPVLGYGSTNQQTVLFSMPISKAVAPSVAIFQNDTGAGDEILNTYNIKGSATVSALCAGPSATSCTSATSLDIQFTRPDPSAIICRNGSAALCNNSYAEITLLSSDSGTRKVYVYQNGQIAVQN